MPAWLTCAMRCCAMAQVALLATAEATYGAVILDRIAVIVDRHAIKISDIQRDLRVTAFLNRASLELSSKAKHQAAERLIDQEIIRQEIVTGQYRRPPESEAAALEKQIVSERYGSSEARLHQALVRYGLSEELLRSQLLWQITVLQFIDQRFQPEVYISDQDVREYYNQHQAALQKQYPGNSSLEALRERIRQLLDGEQINEKFLAWLNEARKHHYIEYKQDALV